jgi:hypothetical protein
VEDFQVLLNTPGERIIRVYRLGVENLGAILGFSQKHQLAVLLVF